MMLVPRNNSLFDDFFRDSFFRGEESKIMRTDIRNLEKEYIIDIDLAGYSKDDIKIDITNGYLSVKVLKSLENSDDTNNYIRRERFLGECSRSFYIGDLIKEEDIKAVFRNGILTVSIPKKDDKKAIDSKKYIEIEE